MRVELPFGGGFGYRGWLRVAIVILAAVIGWLASTSTVHAFGLLVQVHELPMLGFLGWAEQSIIGGIVMLGFNVGAESLLESVCVGYPRLAHNVRRHHAPCPDHLVQRTRCLVGLSQGC